jgi:hypothetical protein
MNLSGFDLYIRTRSNADKSIVGPNFIKVHVTLDWLELLERRARAVKDLGFSSAEINAEPDFVDMLSGEVEFNYWRHHVTAEHFGFTGNTSDGNDDVYTDYVPVAGVRQAGCAMLGLGPVPEGFATYAGAAFFGYGNTQELVNMVKARFPELEAKTMALLMAERIHESASSDAHSATPRTRMRV